MKHLISPLRRQSLLPKPYHLRYFSSSFSSSSTLPEAPKHISAADETKLSPRWLSETKERIGKCITFGLNAAQISRAGAICEELGRDWRELVAGSEGFLTGQKQAGLLRHMVVWGEMDSMGHVNNVTYTRYAESARINWAYNIAMHVDPTHKKEWSELWTPNGTGLILRSIKTDYKFPMTWPDKVSVFHKLRSAPTSSTDSFILDVMILSEQRQRPSARCVEDIVVYDYKKGHKAPLAPYMTNVLGDMYILQEKTRIRNTKRVWALLKEVEELEKESWDREDAKEDFGGAK